jgi:uncharacterized RDD family membrane protein YckC
MSYASPSGGTGPYPPAAPAYGGLAKRFGARILDGLVVGIPVAIVFAVIPGLTVGGFLYGLVLTAAYFGYFVFLESSRGSTLGKQLLGLRVAGAAGASPVTMEASAIRNSWVLIGLLSGIPVLGILASLVSLGIVIAIAVTISSDARNQGLHDRFAGTVVLERA